MHPTAWKGNSQKFANRKFYKLKRMFAEMSEYAPETHRRLMCADWVIVRPSTLTDAAASGRYILGIDRIPKGWHIPREDVAEFVLDHLHDDRYLGRAVTITS